MFETAARAVGATVIPAGTGRPNASNGYGRHGGDAYAGTPDYLKAILKKAKRWGLI